MYMQDISFYFILDWETICFQISCDAILRWSGCSLIQSFKIDACCTFLLLLWNIIFIFPAGTSRRTAEYGLKAYLFYKMLLLP